MDRQDLVKLLAAALADRLARERVKLAPAPEGKRRVRGVVQERVREAHRVLAHRDQEVREPVGGRLDGGGVATGHVAQQVERDLRAQDRGLAQEAPVAARQGVHARIHQRLNRVGQALQRAAGLRRGNQLAEQQRVALRARDQLLADGGRKPRVVGASGRQELGHRVGGEWLQGDPLQPGQVLEPTCFRAAGDQREVAVLGGGVLVPALPQQVAQQADRGAVQPVRVLDQHQHRPGRRGDVDQAAQRAGHPRRGELGVERIGLLGRRVLDAEGDADQGQPGLEIRVELADAVGERSGDVVGVVQVRQDGCAQPAAHRHVRGARGVRAALDRQDVHVRRRLADGADQARLADPGLADQLDQAPIAGSGSVERRVQNAQLLLAADQGSHRGALARSGAGRRADGLGVDRGGLALGLERLDRGALEVVADPAQDRRGGEHRARLGVRHHPRGEVHRVAHQRPDPAGGLADVGAEHRAAVDSGADLERPVTADDVPERVEHPVVVVGRGDRGAGAQDQLAAVAVDVGGDVGDLPLSARSRGRADDLGQDLGKRLRPAAREQPVGSSELDERDGHVAVLAQVGLVVAHVRWQAGRGIRVGVGCR